MVTYLTSASGLALAPGKAIGDVPALVLPDQPDHNPFRHVIADYREATQTWRN
jgi:hypothetical protein